MKPNTKALESIITSGIPLGLVYMWHESGISRFYGMTNLVISYGVILLAIVSICFAIYENYKSDLIVDNPPVQQRKKLLLFF